MLLETAISVWASTIKHSTFDCFLTFDGKNSLEPSFFRPSNSINVRLLYIATYYCKNSSDGKNHPSQASLHQQFCDKFCYFLFLSQKGCFYLLILRERVEYVTPICKLIRGLLNRVHAYNKEALILKTIL